MRTLCSSAFTVVSLVVALVVSLGAIAGCIDDGAYYWSGEVPASGEPPGGTAECQLEVNAPTPAGVQDPRSMTPALVGAHARAQRSGVWTDRAGFTTSNCESSLTD
jgi:hypothetical protein